MLKIIFELGINLVETLMVVDFVTRYLGCKYQDRKRIIGFIGTCVVYFTELSITNYIVAFEGIGALIPVCTTFIYSVIFLKGSLPLKIWASVLIGILVMAIAIATNLIVCSILDYNPNDMITVFNSIRVISVVITKVILFYVSRIILRYKHKNPMDNQALFMLILIPLISLFSLSALMMAALNHEEIKGYILCGMSGILIANVVTYYFFSALDKDYETKLKVKLLEQHYENARQNIENADAFINKMRSFRHDVNNQFTIIYNLVDAEKYSETKEYIKTLTDKYLPDMQSYIYTENDAFNAIMNSKIAICNQKNIFIEVKEKKNSLKDLNAVDTGIMFGNLLDNAIEAADKTESRRITVDIQMKEEYLSIFVTNSISKSVLESNSRLETSKKDKELHGIGIKTVKTLVKKYEGMIQFFEEANEFCCHILLDKSKMLTLK